MPSTPIKVAVIGTGNIGGTLGRAFARAGHDVTFGTRRPAESAQVAGDTSAKVTDVPSALTSADVILLAVPAGAVGPSSARTATPSATSSSSTPPTESAVMARRTRTPHCLR